MFDGFVTKKSILWLGTLGAISFGILLLFPHIFSSQGMCSSRAGYGGGCAFLLNLKFALLPLSLLTLSLIPLPFVWFLRPEVSKIWIRFSIIWLLAFAVLAILAPNNDGGGGWGIPRPSTEAFVILLGVFFYPIVSFLIILMAWLRMRKEK